jgi:ring-1,2-phenylacetyl-CoA epoxidase subunit PaaD
MGIESSNEYDVYRAWQALATVADPEIPVLSVVDMGMIVGVRCEAGRVVVDLTPTFAGCPALETISGNIAMALAREGLGEARVNLVYDPPWSSDRISEEGRRKLLEFGLAPPARDCGGAVDEAMIAAAACPYCGSSDTVLESIFGPTLCRAIHYCNACRQSFEQFKPV